MRMFKRWWLFSLMGIMPVALGAMTLQSTDRKDRQAISMTIYEQDIALIKDRRQMMVPAGSVAVHFSDISKNLLPETVMLRNASGNILSVERIVYNDRRLSPQTLLAAHVGKVVGIVRTDPLTGREFEERARIVSAHDGVVFQVGNRIETGMPERLVFDTLPEGLPVDPVLTIEWVNPAEGKRILELDYLTRGVHWAAHYVARLNEQEDSMDLSGWATIANNSGMSFENARVSLVSGNLNLATMAERTAAVGYATAKNVQSATETLLPVSLSDYYEYPLPAEVVLQDGQLCQYALFKATHVKIIKKWVLNGESYYYRSPLPDGRRKGVVRQIVEFDNIRDNELGIPLPSGGVRFYQTDSRGELQFIGENQIGHTAEKETVNLFVGESFDVTATRRQYRLERQTGSKESTSSYESTHEILLRNAKNRPVSVQVREPIPGSWQMLSENFPHRQEGTVAVWVIDVPAHGQVTLQYHVRVE